MQVMFSINFTFNDRLFQALVRTKQTSVKEYHITVMNGDLESLLHGNHIFIERESGQIETNLDGHKENDHLMHLRKSIAQALQKKLNAGVQ